MQVADGGGVLAFGQGRPRVDGEEAVFLREKSGAFAARLAVEADWASFETGFQRAGHVDTGQAVAAGLLFEQSGADDFDRLLPVVAHRDGAAGPSAIT